MGNKTPKLRAIALREIRFARPSKLNAEKVTAALSTLSRTLTNVDELQKQADLLHIEAVLVSEGINDNDDAFTREELKRAISSPLLKPMNWQHNDEKILGALYAVEARDLEGNPLDVEEIKDQPIELVVQGVIWHQLPHIKVTADEIVQRIEQGNLFVSMECWFDDYEYGLYTHAGELFDSIARKPETVFLDAHLRANGGTGRYNGMRIGRALSGVSFGGIAFVDRPANKRSFILNHFAFDPTQVLEEVGATSDDLDQDLVVTQTTLFSNEKPMEVNMNDLNRAVASDVKAEVREGIAEVLEARERVEDQKRTKADLATQNARNTDLETQLAEAQSTLERLQAAIDQAHAGATTDTPGEIAKIDRALEVKGAGAGKATYEAKIAWIADSRKSIAAVLVDSKSTASDTELIEENSKLKAELDSIKTDLRKREIEYLFADVLEMSDDKVAKFVKTGLANESDEAYESWLEEKKVFAREMLEMKKKGPGYKGDDNAKKSDKQKEKAAEELEAGLLAPTQRETPIDDLDAILRSDHGRAPADIPRVPRSKVSAAADLDTMFEEVDGPDLSGARADESNSASPMGNLVASFNLSNNDKDKEV